MGVFLRWLVRLVTVVVAVAVLALAIAWWMAGRSLPDYEADWQVPGITAPVEIVRSNANVPHIFGSTDVDVYYGLGFAHAQDRLWQMLMIRRTAQGRLSELFGARTLEIDILLRQLDIYGHATRSVAAQTPETIAALEAYAAGVNAWLELVGAEATNQKKVQNKKEKKTKEKGK